jgi:SAM-dependent methyltransferase
MTTSTTSAITVPAATPGPTPGPTPVVAGGEPYVDGRYLEATGGTWHLEDSAFKAKYVDLLVRRNGIPPARVCEIGCGAGGVLNDLHARWPGVEFVGYDISPQAHALSRQFEKPRLRFHLGDGLADSEPFDAVLVMDVVEHVEDCYDFLRRVRLKGRMQVYHIPLELNCSTMMRSVLARGFAVGHIHHYTLDTALEALRYTGHEVVDWLLTPVALERGKLGRTRVTNFVRRLLPPQLCTRLLGGYSLMALCR